MNYICTTTEGSEAVTAEKRSATRQDARRYAEIRKPSRGEQEEKRKQTTGLLFTLIFERKRTTDEPNSYLSISGGEEARMSLSHQKILD